MITYRTLLQRIKVKDWAIRENKKISNSSLTRSEKRAAYHVIYEVRADKLKVLI